MKVCFHCSFNMYFSSHICMNCGWITSGSRCADNSVTIQFWWQLRTSVWNCYGGSASRDSVPNPNRTHLIPLVWWTSALVLHGLLCLCCAMENAQGQDWQKSKDHLYPPILPPTPPPTCGWIMGHKMFHAPRCFDFFFFYKRFVSQKPGYTCLMFETTDLLILIGSFHILTGNLWKM